MGGWEGETDVCRQLVYPPLWVIKEEIPASLSQTLLDVGVLIYRLHGSWDRARDSSPAATCLTRAQRKPGLQSAPDAPGSPTALFVSARAQPGEFMLKLKKRKKKGSCRAARSPRPRLTSW